MILVNYDPHERNYCPALRAVHHNLEFTSDSLTLKQIFSAYDRFEGFYICNTKTLKSLQTIRGEYADEPLIPGQTFDPNIVIAPPLKHYHTLSYGPWLHATLLAKLAKSPLDINPQDYHPLLTLSYGSLCDWLDDAHFCVIDIETSMSNDITCIAYGLYMSDSSVKVVVAEPGNFTAAQHYIHPHKIPKVFHNGLFDNYHLLRNNMPVRNYVADTEYLWHEWQPELPKSLASLSSYFLKPHSGWKSKRDEPKDQNELFAYAAEDVIRTAHIAAHLLTHTPAWALAQAANQMLLVPAILRMSLDGLIADTYTIDRLRAKSLRDLESLKNNLTELCHGSPNLVSFNPNSSKQVANLLYGKLGATPLSTQKSRATDKATLKALATQSPELHQAVSLITQYKRTDHDIQTYYNAHLSHGRLHHTYQIDATPTGTLKPTNLPLWAPDGAQRKYVGVPLHYAPAAFKRTLHASPGYQLAYAHLLEPTAHIIAHYARDDALSEDLAGDFYQNVANRLFSTSVENNFIKTLLRYIHYDLPQKELLENHIDLLIPILAQITSASPKQFVKYCYEQHKKCYGFLHKWFAQIESEAQNNLIIIPPNEHKFITHEQGAALRRAVRAAWLQGIPALFLKQAPKRSF